MSRLFPVLSLACPRPATLPLSGGVIEGIFTLDDLAFSEETAGGGPAGEGPAPATWASPGAALRRLASWSRWTRGAAIALLLAACVPCSAGTVRVTLSGEWATTGNTPANQAAPFSVTLTLDQNPVPDNLFAASFAVDSANLQVNGGAAYHTGTAGWKSDPEDPPPYLVDFRIRDAFQGGDILQIVGRLPSPGFSGDVTAPTMLILDMATLDLDGYYYAGASPIHISAINGRYLSELVDGGPPGAEVPEPATWALLAGGAVVLILRRR